MVSVALYQVILWSFAAIFIGDNRNGEMYSVRNKIHLRRAVQYICGEMYSVRNKIHLSRAVQYIFTPSLALWLNGHFSTLAICQAHGRICKILPAGVRKLEELRILDFLVFYFSSQG